MRYLLILLLLLVSSVAIAGQGMGPGPGIGAVVASGVEIVSGTLDVREIQNVSTISFTAEDFTVPAGAGQVMIVLIAGNFDTSDVDNVQFGSAPLTEVGSSVSTGYGWVQAWYLVNPTPSTDDVLVENATGNDDVALVMFTVSGANQVTPISDNVHSFSASESPRTAGIANMTSGDLAVGIISYDNDGDTTSVSTGTELSSGFVGDWTTYAAAYNTGTGTVNIVFASSVETPPPSEIMGFRIVKGD